VLCSDVGAVVQVCDGAGDFEDFVEGTGREVEFFHGCFYQQQASVIQNANSPDLFARHLGITINSFSVFETFFLNLSGSDDSFADGFTGFPKSFVGEFSEGHRDYFNMEVNPVE